jgi:hypothetical protein
MEEFLQRLFRYACALAKANPRIKVAVSSPPKQSSVFQVYLWKVEVVVVGAVPRCVEFAETVVLQVCCCLLSLASFVSFSL